MPPPQRTVTRGVMVSISLCFHVSALITVGTVSVSLNLKRLCILGRRCRLRFTFLDRKVTVQSRIYWREKIPLILRFFSRWATCPFWARNFPWSYAYLWSYPYIWREDPTGIKCGSKQHFTVRVIPMIQYRSFDRPNAIALRGSRFVVRAALSWSIE